MRKADRSAPAGPRFVAAVVAWVLLCVALGCLAKFALSAELPGPYATPAHQLNSCWYDDAGVEHCHQEMVPAPTAIAAPDTGDVPVPAEPIQHPIKYGVGLAPEGDYWVKP